MSWIIWPVLVGSGAANRRYDRERDTLNWYGSYRSLLEKLGWSTEKRRSGGRLPDQASLQYRQTLPDRPTFPARSPGFPFARVIADRPRFTAHTTVLNLLHNSVKEDAFGATQAALEALRGLDDRDRGVVSSKAAATARDAAASRLLPSALAPMKCYRRLSWRSFFSRMRGCHGYCHSTSQQAAQKCSKLAIR